MLLDCGLMFPEADMPGIDLVLPDFTYLRENARPHRRLRRHPRSRGSRRRRSRSCCATCRSRSTALRSRSASPAAASRRRDCSAAPQLIPVADGERRKVGPFDLEFIPVTHSVPHGFATAFHTPQGVILHSGDFKLDLTPVDGRLTDLSRIGAIAVERRRPAAAVRLDERRGGRPRAVRARRRPGADATSSASTTAGASSRHRSRATSTASSRSPTPPSPRDASSPRSGCR